MSLLSHHLFERGCKADLPSVLQLAQKRRDEERKASKAKL